MGNFAVIIPAMNEENSIAEVIKDIRQYHQCDVIVIDDGSTDHTALVARKMGAIVLPHVTNLGAWRATQTGLRYALSKGYDKAISFDADGQHCAEYIQTLIDKSEEGYDLVIGSCTARGSAGRHIAWKFFQKLTGIQIKDLTSGFRCYSREAMEILVSKQATMFEYQDVGVLLLLANRKKSSAEVTVEMNLRTDGISRIFNSWISVGKYLIYTFILSITKTTPTN